MGKTVNKYFEGLAWLRFVLNPESGMPAVSDWNALYEFTDMQKITGLCDPTKYNVRIGIEELSLWLGDIEQIKASSMMLNKKVEELSQLLDEAGFKHCVLKGQGNAEMYPEPLLRMSGDIDVWVDEDEKTVLEFVRERYPEAVESYKHIKFPVFDDVPVDVHVTPLKFYCPKHNKRLQRWISEHKKEQFEHRILLSGGEKEINVPTAEFNAIYQLGHMLIHLYDEGIGLRQVVDYYYVLKGHEFSEHERFELVETIRFLGMYKFAQAILWIESYVLGLPIDRCIVKPDERRGKQLLKDILEGGNFGHYSQRYNGRNGFYYRGCVGAWRIVKFLPIAPSEGAARLVSKMGAAVKHAIN